MNELSVKESLQLEYLELSGEEPDKRWSEETLEEKIQDLMEVTEEEAIPFVEEEHPVSFEYEGDDTREFVFNHLVGSLDFKEYINKYMHDHIWIVEEKDDINYYDWLFHQHLIDSFIDYARFLVKEKNEIYQGFLEELDIEDNVNVDWHDIYTVISKNNRGIRFANYFLKKDGK